MRRLALLVMLFTLAGNSHPPSTQRIEAEAQKFITRCRAEHLVAIVVESPERFTIRTLKKPEDRTAADLVALRCLGRQFSGIVDFRPAADPLLGIMPPA